MVATEEALMGLVAGMRPFSRIAVDTEADSLHCYFEKLCLIQVSVPGQDWLIDPLAGVSLQPFFEALQGKELIFHGADYDLRLLRRVGFGGPIQVFDTMIAARLCGVTEFSLAALLKQHFGLEIPKTSQKANWARRPLSSAMLAYAINDTRHLHALAEIFGAKLDELGRRAWFEQSCERAIRATEIIKEKDMDEAWRISGSGALRGRPAAILREIWRWRDAEARAVDRPPFHILNNERMIEIARDVDGGKRSTPHHLKGSRLRRFHEAIDRALAMPESEWPVFVRSNRSRPSREEEEQMKSIRIKRDEAAQQLLLDPSLVAPKAVIEGLVLRREETIERLMPWQREVLGF